MQRVMQQKHKLLVKKKKKYQAAFFLSFEKVPTNPKIDFSFLLKLHFILDT